MVPRGRSFVAVDQFGHSGYVLGRETDHLEAPVREKCDLLWTTPKSHHVARCRSLGSSSKTSPGTSPARVRTSSCSAAPRGGEALRVSVFRKPFSNTAKAIAIPSPHPHELRHTAASLAIASGADIKVVQQMLGHRSAIMTLDTYGDLFENRLVEVADARYGSHKSAPGLGPGQRRRQPASHRWVAVRTALKASPDSHHRLSTDTVASRSRASEAASGRTP